MPPAPTMPKWFADRVGLEEVEHVVMTGEPEAKP
jgi:hypothetical protein